jgi:hypothetical protein
MNIITMPDDKLKELLEKYIEKSDRYKRFVNEETDRTEEKLIEINQELKSREEFRKGLKVVIPNQRYKHFVDEEE